MSTAKVVGNQDKKNQSIGRGRGKRSNQQKPTSQIRSETGKSESQAKTPDKPSSTRASRGRGWRRPDQAIYVPKALRKKENGDSQSTEDDRGEYKACQLIKRDEGIFTDSDSFHEQKGNDRHSLTRLEFPEKDETAVSVALNKDQKSCDISNEKGTEAPVDGSSESRTANNLNSNKAVLLDINKKSVDISDINQDDSYEKKNITEREIESGNKQKEKIRSTENDTCGKSCPETDAKEEEELQKHEDKKGGDSSGAAQEIQVIDKCQSRPLVTSCVQSDRNKQLGQNLLENQAVREIPLLGQQKPVIENCQSNSPVESVLANDNANNEEEISFECQERQENNISTDQQQCTSNTSLVSDKSITEGDYVKKEEGELSVERIETKGEKKQNQGNDDAHRSSSTDTDVSTEMYNKHDIYPQVGMCSTFPDAAAAVETDSKNDEIHDEECLPKETSSRCVFNDILMDLKDESHEILNGDSEQNHQLDDKSDSNEVKEVTSDVKDSSEKNITLTPKQDDTRKSDNFKNTETQGSIESEEEKNNIALDIGNTEEGKGDLENVVNNEKKFDEKETKHKKKSKKKKGEDQKDEKKKKKSKKKESENEELKEKENDDKHKLKKKEKKKASKDDSGTKSKESKSKEKAKDKKEGKCENGNEDNNDDDDESWESKFNEDGECLDAELLEELTEVTGIKKPSKHKTQFDYYALPSKEVILDDDSGYGHIVELYDFSPELKTQDLVQLLSSFKSQGYEIKWVDDTHALAVFSSEIAAKQAIQMCSSPIMKLRPVSQGTSDSKSKAKKCFSFLQPYKPRPQTTNLAAHRLVTGALGVRSTMSKEEREREREKIKEAKEQKRQEKQRKADIWGD